jgi:hypothetical protein
MIYIKYTNEVYLNLQGGVCVEKIPVLSLRIYL